VIVMHYTLSCIDNLFMTGLMIWGVVAVSSDSAKGFATAPEETGLSAFLTVTTVNIVMSFLYVCSHVCAVPVTFTIIAMSPERFGFAHRRGDGDLDWVEEDIELENNTALAETIRDRRRE